MKGGFKSLKGAIFNTTFISFTIVSAISALTFSCGGGSDSKEIPQSNDNPLIIYSVEGANFQSNTIDVGSITGNEKKSITVIVEDKDGLKSINSNVDWIIVKDTTDLGDGNYKVTLEIDGSKIPEGQNIGYITMYGKIGGENPNSTKQLELKVQKEAAVEVDNYIKEATINFVHTHNGYEYTGEIKIIYDKVNKIYKINSVNSNLAGYFKIENVNDSQALVYHTGAEQIINIEASYEDSNNVSYENKFNNFDMKNCNLFEYCEIGELSINTSNPDKDKSNDKLVLYVFFGY